jgi:hypothetical protein
MYMLRLAKESSETALCRMIIVVKNNDLPLGLC